jgi:hypothetical protein
MTETSDGKALIMYDEIAFLTTDISPLSYTVGYTQLDLKTRQIDYSIIFNANGTSSLTGQYVVESGNGSYWVSSQDE